MRRCLTAVRVAAAFYLAVSVAAAFYASLLTAVRVAPAFYASLLSAGHVTPAFYASLLSTVRVAPAFMTDSRTAKLAVGLDTSLPTHFFGRADGGSGRREAILTPRVSLLLSMRRS